jgi:hypothetical protein
LGLRLVVHRRNLLGHRLGSLQKLIGKRASKLEILLLLLLLLCRCALRNLCVG